MDEIQNFENAQFGRIRISVDADGKPLFCLADICRALDLQQVSKVKPRLYAKGVHTIPLLSNGGTQQTYFISEPNFYKCIFQSRKKEAEAFQDWVCSEVLPSIRKSGGYMVAKESDTPEMIMARALKVADETIKRHEEQKQQLALENKRQAQELEVKDAQITKLNTAVSEMQPKVSYVDTILQCKDTVQTSIIAQDYGKTAKAFNILLRNFGIQRKIGTTWVLYAKKIYLKRICAVQDIQIQTQGRNGRSTHILRMDAAGTPLPLRHAERTRHTASDREIINPNK